MVRCGAVFVVFLSALLSQVQGGSIKFLITDYITTCIMVVQ